MDVDGDRCRRRLALVVVTALVLAAVALAAFVQPAEATTLEKLTLEQLAQRATTIVVAEISTVTGELVTLGRGATSGSYPQTRVSAAC